MKNPKRNIFYLFWTICVIIIIGILGFNFASPRPITFPKKAEYQARLQIVVEGDAIDFSQQPFQNNALELCSNDIIDRPFGVYEGNSQIIHMHWENLTGANLLRNYGFKNTGPFENYLGVNLNNFPDYEPISIQGNLITTPEETFEYYVYTGNQFTYTRRDETEFLNRSIKDLLTRELGEKYNWLSNINAHAQIGVESGEDLENELFISEQEAGPQQLITIPSEQEEVVTQAPPSDITAPVIEEVEEMIKEENNTDDKSEEVTIVDTEKLYNIIGNIVLFIQEKEPTEEEVIKKFLNLEKPQRYNCN